MNKQPDELDEEIIKMMRRRYILDWELLQSKQINKRVSRPRTAILVKAPVLEDNWNNGQRVEQVMFPIIQSL